jgi:uncharacterized protein YukE
VADRVLSTETAKQSIQKMSSIINGPFLDQITALNREGQVLSQPNNWDGRLAEQFRSKWPEINQSLTKAKEDLEQLRADIKKINDNIMQAGGNQ